MKKTLSAAEASYNGDYFRITTFSIGMLDYAEPGASPHYLAPDVGDNTLGQTLRLALSASKHASMEEFQKIFHSSVIQQLGKEREAWAMKQYGYKTKRAMYKNMAICSIKMRDGQIDIQPTHMKAVDSYTVKNDTGPFPLYVSESATDAELGAALREGFKRCTSSVK